MSKLKIKQIFIMFASAAAVAAINYSLFDPYYAAFMLLILIAHELGHYTIAKINKLNPDLPYFIPLPVFSIGITHIKKLNLSSKFIHKSILFYGPFTAFIASIYLLLLSFIFLPSSTLSILILCAFELFFNYFGSDGKKYRALNKI